MIEEKPIKIRKQFNLAGVIPTHGQKLDFNFPWHDSLMPIGCNYLAVEKSIYDCVLAGCKTIWIICSKEMQPLLRYRIGDCVIDPIKLTSSTTYGKIANIQKISIYYVLFHPKDTDRRDSLAWSILHGANSAFRVHAKMSRWTTPDRYFVSFPYGMFNSYIFNKHRKFANSPGPFYVSYKGKSFREGLFLPFTFDPEDFKLSRNKFRKNENTEYDYNGNYIREESERWTGQNFTHDFVFSDIKKENASIMEVPWYYDVSSWEGLKKWLSSDFKLDKPMKVMSQYSEWNPIGVDNNVEE